ncbi:coiled-coil domain-containing protein 136 isoform X2 [Rhineura floridana]|uniref:coiled-coil domain-containing protein 136 isoform X2 n=1 Tax=Rhineura floridana TaxID=261503 RepID=UPI002AC816AD|nr:coiled-coil domain-containing protein 136 isoform X2 [Rhineura floridana]
METTGLQLLGRRKERAGEVDAPNVEVNEEEEEEEDEEEEEEVRDLGSSDDEKGSDLLDQEVERDLRAQVMQLLDEVEEAREAALKHEGDSLELQGLLEDERLASAQQAEIFTKQIQRLQAQMRSLKDEFDSLQEVKDVELERLERELRETNEEIHSLRLDAEEAAAVHENEVAGLQEEICRLKAELDRVQRVHNEYDMEVTALRAEINMKGPGTGDSQPAPEMLVVTHFDDRLSSASEEVARLQEELRTLRARYQELSDEYHILQESNKIMVNQLERLEAMKYRSRSKSDDSPSLDSDSEGSVDHRHSTSRQTKIHTSGSVSFKSMEIVGMASDANADEKMSKPEEESECELRYQLKMEEEKAELVHAQCDQAQYNLREMEGKCQLSQHEREQLHEELRLCKEEIERLNGTIPSGGRVPAGGMKPFAVFAVLAGGLLLYPCLKRYSNSWMPT